MLNLPLVTVSITLFFDVPKVAVFRLTIVFLRYLRQMFKIKNVHINKIVHNCFRLT